MASLGRVRIGLVGRIGSHLVIWTIVLVPTVLEMIRGWQPLYSDDATITLRSYEILSLHPPLLGQFSRISSHISFDPGPLQYVFLAVPTHIDHLQGGLWGSALVCGLVLSVAVEAMWSLRRWLGCVLVALAVVDLAWTAPSVFDHQIWNPDFGLIFLLASIVLAFAVAVGSFGWWPVLVFTASVTAQAELFYAMVAVGLVIVCPFLGGWHSGRPRRLRWLMIGFGVGILCWLPPLIQQVFESPGNLSSLVSGRKEASLGLAFGLRSLGRVAWPSPLPFSQYSLSFLVSSIESVPVVCGVVVLAVTAAIASTAWRYGRKDLAALATIGLTCSVFVVVSFASVPSAHRFSLSWLVIVLWVVAYLLALIVVWAVIEVVRSHALQKVSLKGLPSLKRSTVFGALVAVLLVMGLVGVWRLPPQASVNSEESAQVSNLVQTVERNVQPRAVTIKFWPTPYPYLLDRASSNDFDYGQAILWQLTAAGFEPQMQPYFTYVSGITYSRDPSSPIVNVIMTYHGNYSHIQKVVIGTYHPPAIPLHTQMLIPRTGAILRGSKLLDASAAGGTDVTGVQFVVTGRSLTNHVVGTAIRNRIGWLATWDTTTIPNGAYTLQSVATETGGTRAMSPPIDVTVDNGPT